MTAPYIVRIEGRAIGEVRACPAGDGGCWHAFRYDYPHNDGLIGRDATRALAVVMVRAHRKDGK